MSVMNSPPDFRAHDDHLKDLLGQRAARADLHGRYPSLSEFSDSPSVYSHAQFSPRPPDRPFLDGHAHSFRFPHSPKTYSPSLAEPRSPISDRERLNFPNSSSLDLEDDPRSSSELNSLRDDDHPDSGHEDEGEDVTQISMLGPKMRFHTPAPWEEDEDDEAKSIVEEPSKRSKKKADTAKKGWGLSRANAEPRPSSDSTRSGKGKQSFETASNYSASGALAILAQASMSSTSLGVHQSPHSLRDKLSLPRLRSRTPSNVGLNEPFSPVNASPVSRIATPPHPEMYTDERSTLGHSSNRSEISQHEYTHPYANPDLVRSVDHDLPPPSPSQLAFNAIRSDSNATLTDTTPSSSVSQFRSTTTFSMTPGTSTTSMNPTLNESSSSSRMIGKGISSPMPVDKAALHPDTLNKLHGYQQSPMTPLSGMSPGARNRDTQHSTITMGGLAAWGENSGGALKLISLEEAQAQAKERARSQTAHPAISSPFAGPSRPTLELDVDAVQRIQGRARSTSAGGKGRTNLDSPQRSMSGDSPVGPLGPPRTVVKKKSGFMRLFNGKERVSPSSPPPPVPLFSADAFAPPPPPQYSRPRQASAHRVPVPSLSPNMADDGSGPPGSASSGSPAGSPPTSTSGSSGSSAASRLQQQQQLSARRKVPDLSIVTSPPAMNLGVKAPYTAPLSAGSNEMSHHHLTPTTAATRPELRSNGSSPSSAPPNKTDFVGLSIRPVSTLFSRDIKELAVTEEGSLRMRPSLEADTGTPTTATTATTAISPLSPDFPHTKSIGYGRSSDEKSAAGDVQLDERDQSSVIQALQEQILSTRRAWQRQIWELEGQVRDLKAEVEELRAAENGSEYCAACGRGGIGRVGAEDGEHGVKTLEELKKVGVKVSGVVNRPRARTGVGSRFASGK